MRRVFLPVLAVVVGVVASNAWAALNLNSSRSNIYRLVYNDDLMDSAQACIVLDDLEAWAAASRQKSTITGIEMAVRESLAKRGIATRRVQKVVVRLPDARRSYTAIIVLSNLADEAQALAATEPDATQRKTITVIVCTK